MKFSNIFEKLEFIFNMIINSNIFTILLILIIGIFMLRISKKINNKKMTILISFVELIVLGIIIYEENAVLLKIGTELINNIFLNFYFPSAYVYLFIFVVSLIIFTYTILNRFISKTYRVITNTYFLIFNFIFILLLQNIAKNNIDIFAKESLFTNTNTLVLLELSTLLFFIYVITNFIVYFTNSIILFVSEKQVSKVKYNNELEPLNTQVVFENKEISTYKTNISFQELVKSIENSSNAKDLKIDLVPEVGMLNDEKEEAINTIDLVPEVDTGFRFIDPSLFKESFADDVIKNNEKEIINEKLNFIDFNILENKTEERLTLNDYKLFSNMLKTVIQNNNTSKLSITDILNKNLLEKYSFEEYSKFEKILNSCLN